MTRIAAGRRLQQLMLSERLRRQRYGLPPRAELAQWSDAQLDDIAGAPLRWQRTGWFAPTDDRRDPAYGPALPVPLLAHARRACYLIGAGAVASRRRGRVRLHHQAYGGFNALCPSEPFWCQPTVIERRGEAFGFYGYTGYLIAPDAILTCWHGWEHFNAESQLAIFDYAAGSPCDQPVDLPEASVVPVRADPWAIAPDASRGATAADDWVILRLERALPGRAPARPAIGRAGEGDAVYTLGHPCGLPLKLASNASVLSAGTSAFYTDLDTFSGNSGSPVFDAVSNALLGIVIEGQKGEGDFEPVPAQGCYIGNRIDHRLGGQRCVPCSAFADAVTGLDQ